MSTSAPYSGLPLPENSDILNVEAIFGNYADGADTLLIPRYADSSSRNTGMTAGTQAGMMCAVNGGAQYHDGTAWHFWEDWRMVRRTTDLSRTAATLVADTQLVLPLLGGATYEISAVLHWTNSAGTNPGATVTWTCPAGITAAAVKRFVVGTSPGQNPIDATAMVMLETGADSAVNVGASISSGFSSAHYETLTMTTVSAGNLVLNWGAVGTTPTVTLRANSIVMARRVNA